MTAGRQLFIIAGLICTTLAMPASADLPNGAYGWMRTLAGACWSATTPNGLRDTQCYHTQYDRFLRGTIEIASPDGIPPYRGDSLLVWEATEARIDFLYWGSSSRHGRMIGRIEAGRIVFATDAGTPNRTVWTQIDPDSFEVVQQQRNGETWVDTLTLRYRRQAPATVGQ
jgi:hypothetical protein